MNQKLRRAIERWQTADADARAAEHKLTQAYADAFARKDTLVAWPLIDQVARSRAMANELMMNALALMKQAHVDALEQAPPGHKSE